MIKNSHYHFIDSYVEDILAPALYEVFPKATGDEVLRIHNLVKRNRFLRADQHKQSKTSVLLDASHRLQSAQYGLEFVHQCRVDACGDYYCELCKMNPLRPCTHNIMKSTYYEGSRIDAKCDQPLSVQLINLRTKKIHRVNAEIALIITSEQALLRGLAGMYPLCSDNLGQLVLNLTEKGRPLIGLKGTVGTRELSNVIRVNLQAGKVALPKELIALDSSRSLLGYPQANILMLATVLPGQSDCPPLNKIRCGVSQAFTTATRRARPNSKIALPLKTSRVDCLVNISTGRKGLLNKILEDNYIFPEGSIPPEQVESVKDFQDIARIFNQTENRLREIMDFLGMSEGDWIETCSHAATALEPDYCPRSWTPLTPVEGIYMIVYNCKLARILFEEGPFGFMRGNEIVEPMSWTAHEQDLVAHLDVEARKAWYKKGHPGWAFYPSKPVEVFEELQTSMDSASMGDGVLEASYESSSKGCMEKSSSSYDTYNLRSSLYPEDETLDSMVESFQLRPIPVGGDEFRDDRGDDYGEVWENAQRPPSMSQLVDEPSPWQPMTRGDGCEAIPSGPLKRGREDRPRNMYSSIDLAGPSVTSTFCHSRCQLLPPHQQRGQQRGFPNKRMCLKSTYNPSVKCHSYGLGIAKSQESIFQPGSQGQRGQASGRWKQSQVDGTNKVVNTGNNPMLKNSSKTLPGMSHPPSTFDGQQNPIHDILIPVQNRSEDGELFRLQTQHDGLFEPWIPVSMTYEHPKNATSSYLDGWNSMQNDDTRIFANEGILRP